MTPPTLTDHLHALATHLGVTGELVPFTDPPQALLASADQVEQVADYLGVGVTEHEGRCHAVATIAGQRVAFVSPVPKVVVRR